MNIRRVLSILILPVAVAAGCATTRPVYAPWPPTEPPTQDLLALATPLDTGEIIRAISLGKMEGASQHLIQLGGAEELHRHMTHDLTVVVLRGQGILDLDEEGKVRAVPFQEGTILVVPRGVPHAARTTGSGTCLVFAVFSPPLEAQDYVPGK